MSAKNTIKIAAASLFVALLVSCYLLYKRTQSLREERDRYRQNTSSLLTEVQRYKTSDSLNVAQVQALRLTVEEFRRLRADDAALIKSLRVRNRDLSQVATALTEQVYELSSRPVDTIIVRDSVLVKAKYVHSGDAWYDFQGTYSDDRFEGRFAARDSLTIVETVRYRRFLGFLWKTRNIKDWQVDVANRNPHVILQGYEWVVIEK